MEFDSEPMKAHINDCLTQQICEFELLQSMYPEPGEIILSDKTIIDEIKIFIEEEDSTEYIPNHLDYKINLNLNDYKLEIFINLPTSYPTEEPDVYARCNKLNRLNESQLNSELLNYIKENSFGDVCIYTAISWLQENFERFTVTNENSSTDLSSESKSVPLDKSARMWIHSHHIYNKKKIEEIVKKARVLKLTGFCLPGKPGIVCIEGPLAKCEEWWRDIKAMAWKKIVVKKTELFELEEDYKKFTHFEEINLSMSKLSKFMHKLGFGLVFNEIFGLNSSDCKTEPNKCHKTS